MSNFLQVSFQKFIYCKHLRQDCVCVIVEDCLTLKSEQWHSDGYFYDSTAFESPCQHDKHLKSCERLISESWLRDLAQFERSLSGRGIKWPQCFRARNNSLKLLKTK